MLTDDSFSGFMEEMAVEVHRSFTEITLLHQTSVHQLYRAKRFGRWYLLKGLIPELRDSDFHRQMLLKEMEILMPLNHPNIMSCMGIQRIDDYVDSKGEKVSVGECLVLEYIEGQTLDNYARHSLSDNQGVYENIMGELLDAISYMHASGITHRDLKPSNIMITSNGNHVKLIDFSLADTNSHAILKQPSGTRQYMSPEQSTSTTPDERNDIFSLGKIIGQLPLPHYWKKISERCLLPIDQRYPNIEALRKDVANRRQGASRRRMAMIILPILIAVFAAGALLWGSLSSRQDKLYNELSRMPNITGQALKQLETQIDATGLSLQMDTISQWEYLDPKINEKILAVNAFVYDYALDSLPDLTDDERILVLQQMLDRWQQWHDNIVRRAKFLIKNDGTYVTHYSEQSLKESSSR